MADKIKRKVSMAKKNAHDSTSSSDSSDSKQQQQTKKKKDKSSSKKHHHSFSEPKETPLSVIRETHAHLIPQSGSYYGSDNSSSLESIGEDDATKHQNPKKGIITPCANGLCVNLQLKDKCTDNEMTMIHHINQLYKRLDRLEGSHTNIEHNVDILLAERRLIIQQQIEFRRQEEEEEKNSYTNCIFSYLPF
jgi:hypothetical protein